MSLALLGLAVPTGLSLLTPAVQAWALDHVWWVAVPTLVLLVPFVWLSVLAFGGDVTPSTGPVQTPIERAKADLTAAVRKQWKPEIVLRGLAPEKRMAVSLTPTSRLVRSEPAEAEPRLRLTRAEEAVAAYKAIPSRRCVILGGPRSGKTSAAVLLTLGLVGEEAGAFAGPVPVFVSLADWKPDLVPGPGRKWLIDWLSEKLAEDYPFLRKKSRYGRKAPYALLDGGHVRLVLDGLDEVVEPGDDEQTRELRAEAIRQIAELAGHWQDRPGEPVGLILTCRAEEYEGAVDRARAEIREARVVEIEPIELFEATEFVKERATPRQTPKWAGVLDGLPASAPLAQVLTTPLMVMLALEMYNDPDRDPAELLECPGEHQVEVHLLNGMVERAFPDRWAGRPDRWQGAQARQWLSFLATRMKQRGNVHDLKWWELPELTGRLERVLAGIAGLLLIGPPVAVGMGIVLNGVWGFRAAVVCGLLVGAAFAVSLGWLSAWSTPPPAEMYFGKTGRLGAVLVSGGLVGLIGAGAGWLAFGTVQGMFEMAALGVPIAGAYAGASTDGTVRAASPTRLLRNDIKVAVVFGLAYGVPIGLVASLALERPVLGVLFGISCGLAGGLTYGLPWLVTLDAGKDKVGVIAWVHFLLIRLTNKERIPWNLLAFLDEAHQRGVLRQVGPVYQFRHVSLRDVLAEPEPPASGVARSRSRRRREERSARRPG